MNNKQKQPGTLIISITTVHSSLIAIVLKRINFEHDERKICNVLNNFIAQKDSWLI